MSIRWRKINSNKEGISEIAKLDSMVRERRILVPSKEMGTNIKVNASLADVERI